MFDSYARFTIVVDSEGHFHIHDTDVIYEAGVDLANYDRRLDLDQGLVVSQMYDAELNNDLEGLLQFGEIKQLFFRVMIMAYIQGRKDQRDETRRTLKGLID